MQLQASSISSTTSSWLTAAAAGDPRTSVGLISSVKTRSTMSAGRHHAAAADEFPVSFAIIVVAASFSFVAVICLLLMLTSSSSYRRCCPSLTSARRTTGASIQSVSAAVHQQPRLVRFTVVNCDHNEFECTPAGRGARQLAEQHDDQRGKETEPTTAARVKSACNQQRRTDDDRVTAMVRSCLTSRSLSVPAITDSSGDDTCRRAAVHDKSTVVVSARVDSGVSGMQSSVCTLSSSTPQDVEPTQSADRLDTAVGASPVWNLSQMSMDVHSCPDGTSSGVTVLPPLFLCQYVNGYSDAMLMHVVDRHRPSWHSGLTSATQCADDDVDEESRRCGDSVEWRGALTVQTTAVVEPRRAAADHDDRDSPCVCGQSHDLPPPPPDITRHTDPSTINPRDLALPLHLPPPPTSVHCQPLHPPASLSGCDGARRQPSIESLDTAVHAVKATTLSSLADVDRRRLLARLLLGRHDELALSPVYCNETYF